MFITQSFHPPILNGAIPGRDTRWLEVEICREFQKSRCMRSDKECRYAHPPAHVEVANGKVISCYDFLKGKCHRENPPCKYFHPPEHIQKMVTSLGQQFQAVKQQVNQLNQMMLLRQHQLLPLPGSIPSPVMPGRFSIPTMPGTSPFLQGIPHIPGATHLPSVPYLGMFSAMRPVNTVPAAVSASVPVSTGTTNTSLIAAAAAAAAAAASPSKPIYKNIITLCEEFRRGSCQLSEANCPYAHPPPHLLNSIAENGIVKACFKFIEGKCSAEHCQFFHPPAHLLKLVKESSNMTSSGITMATTSSTVTLANGTPPVSATKKRALESDEPDLTRPTISTPYKHFAMDKSGIPIMKPVVSLPTPVYPASSIYQTAMMPPTVFSHYMHAPHSSVATLTPTFPTYAFPGMAQHPTAATQLVANPYAAMLSAVPRF